MAGDYVQITGAKETAARINALPQAMALEVRNRVLRKAARPAIAQVRQLTPEREGLSRQSVGVKLWPSKSLQAGTNIVLAIVGFRRGSQWGGRANIAHLLERGWRTARGGTLKRESGRTAATSALTGERGQGVAVGRHPGFHMHERAARITGLQAREIIITEVPRIIARLWKQKIAAAWGARFG